MTCEEEVVLGNTDRPVHVIVVGSSGAFVSHGVQDPTLTGKSR